MERGRGRVIQGKTVSLKIVINQIEFPFLDTANFLESNKWKRYGLAFASLFGLPICISDLGFLRGPDQLRVS